MLRACGSFLVVLFATRMAIGVDVQPTVGSDVRALAPVRAYVGSWRGVGQPSPGANQPPWNATFQWTWEFADDRAALKASLSGDIFYRMLELRAGSKPGQVVLLATINQGPNVDGIRLPQRFSGAFEKDALILAAENPEAFYPDRISLSLADNGDRLVAQYAKRADGGAYKPLAQIELKRQGTPFAKGLANGKECVVTGSPARIAVEHQGTTYYVCCAGCRDYFLEHPESALAEYRQRTKDKQSKPGE